MRWRTPLRKALVESHANRADGSSPWNADSGGVPGGETGARPSYEACPPRRVSISRPASPTVNRAGHTNPVREGITSCLAGGESPEESLHRPPLPGREEPGVRRPSEVCESATHELQLVAP